MCVTYLKPDQRHHKTTLPKCCVHASLGWRRNGRHTANHKTSQQNLFFIHSQTQTKSTKSTAMHYRWVGGRILRSGCLSVYLCQFVSLSTYITQKPHEQISPNFLHMWRVSMARSSSDGTSMHRPIRIWLCGRR